MRVLDLFSGIGGFSLGLERAGMKTVAFCEIDPFCRRVLAKHWPEVPCYDDVRELTGARLSADGIAVDVICGGFPCQDVSFAGKRAGLEGARSHLWWEYWRLIGEIRPRYVIVENVPGLLSLGMGDVLGGLAAIGFDAVWDCIPACAVGAPHRRDRVWLVAHANGEQLRQQPGRLGGKSGTSALLAGNNGEEGHAIYANGQSQHDGALNAKVGGASQPLANSTGCRCDKGPTNGGGSGQGTSANQWAGSTGGGWWFSEPDVGRVASRVPNRVDRLRALGNAVVPQIPELIGRAICEIEQST